MITVRNATPSDCESARALEKEIFKLHRSNRPDMFRFRENSRTREQFEEMLSDNRLVLLAEEDGAVVGQVFAFIREIKNHPVFNDAKWLEIDEISIAEGKRNMGIGTMLFSALKNGTRDMGLNHIELTVWGFNDSAKAFYRKMGMQSGIDRLEMNI
ncbi:MAG: GNAT family N-acetyltransferase [Eubacteriales bacterium]|nr:GNAT family N-acetyltransferase [Eubacteriales bacterium]MDD3883275.1 GNAT family N-acetyltransferase [Eubacteriales bacterium]MDD4513913.1 GNAT family N-acetyltransferase [Eubacteriales bacterium]